MSKSTHLHFTLLSISLLFLHICDGVSVLALKTSEIDAMAKKVCNKSIEDCSTEPEVDSESNRRVLLIQKKQILTAEVVISLLDVLEALELDGKLLQLTFFLWELGNCEGYAFPTLGFTILL
ncbi:hypothetical protein Patl1_26085 [Pistacia atlantica]|uniref:Uncharacterized protein n=1 Tax=Pistacia atlantica TaxID=434234 RepID=A0ACC1B524_9ROSI|nr:hypothetical protein Patl1_26085 [Pistacia atlantica]